MEKSVTESVDSNLNTASHDAFELIIGYSALWNNKNCCTYNLHMPLLWVPSHVGIDGNEKDDFLAKTASEEGVSPTGSITFDKLSSLKKIELHHLGRTPLSHPWYFGRNPGGSFKLMPRKYQAAFSGFHFWHRTATAGSDVVQSGRPIFDDFFQHLWPYIGNNTANVVFQMVKRLWLIRIDQ
ncbi:adhesion G protein-coupled receptor B2 [Trichonephila clavipes]|nr:adhesion G protein-coupled receptor B2 [Trichonephila clavipes]